MKKLFGKVGIIAIVIALILSVGAISINAQTPTPTPLGSIEVLGVWGAEEAESFMAMVAPWEKETGGRVNFTGTRDLIAVLTTRVQAGNPPDIAILPNPGQMRELAEDGRLVALDEFMDMDQFEEAYSETWRELGSFNGDLYAIFMKATNKGIIWYNPAVFEENNWQIPASWDEMIEISDEIAAGQQTPEYPWSIGVESAQASGWPGTDWIAQIFLSKYGGEVYDQWVNHEIPWTDPRVKDAWEMFGDIVFTEGYIAGGAVAVLATNFVDASYLPFQDPPRAAMHYGGDYVQGFLVAQFPNQVPGEDYAFFAFPVIDPDAVMPAATPTPVVSPTPTPQITPAVTPGVAQDMLVVTGGADLVVAFRDNPTVRSFMEYIASAEAQEIWVERGGFTSVNNNVDLDAYPDELARQSAEMLATATVFRYGAGDIMPSAVQTAWWTGVLEYLQNPNQLDSILQNIENQAVAAYQE